MIGTPMAKFEYVGRQLRRSQPGPHTDTMLAEVLEEARLGRIVGPLRAPHWWPGRTVALHCLEGALFAAAAFAISQPDGEGAPRSDVVKIGAAQRIILPWLPTTCRLTTWSRTSRAYFIAK